MQRMAKPQYDYYATTAKGMEPLLADEIQKISGGPAEIKGSGVRFSGSLEVGYRACLWSRIANRILLPLATFPASDPEMLYEGVKSLNWEDHLTSEKTLAVDFSTSNSQITHSHYGALKVKDAIVDQFRDRTGSRPSVNTQSPDVRVNVYLRSDQATVSLDLSGESLHRRGYREEAGEAPLKENLAAALLTLAGWPSLGDDKRAFLDPMCGSGTLPIEAALLASNIAPGLGRKSFGFMGWDGHVPMLWKRIVQEAKDQIITDPRRIPKIVGYDQDFRVIRIALQNLERAGLRGKVHFEKRELAQCKSIGEKGVLIVNPPYGLRLGEVEGLKPLYGKLGDLLKQEFKGWSGFIFTGSPELSKFVGLKATRRHVLFNGAVECRLLEYELY